MRVIPALGQGVLPRERRVPGTDTLARQSGKLWDHACGIMHFSMAVRKRREHPYLKEGRLYLRFQCQRRRTDIRRPEQEAEESKHKTESKHKVEVKWRSLVLRKNLEMAHWVRK